DRERREIMGVVTNVVGKHPFSLQHFCDNLFQRATSGGATNMPQAIRGLLNDRDSFLACFSEPVHQLFTNINKPTLQYLFLKRCEEADQKGESVATADLDDEWIKRTLADVGYHAPFAVRLNLLEGLEIHGLCVPESAGRHRQIIAVPVIY